MTSFEKIQKAALARLEAGEDLEHILQDYADYEEELRPILEEASGVSISDLMQRPRPKAKLKAKNEPNKAFAPMVLVALAVLGALIYLLLGSENNVEIIDVEPVDVTTVPATTEPQIALVDDSQCAMLGQQSVNYTLNNQEPQIQYGNSGSTSTGSYDMEVTPASLVLPTASPMGTMAPMPESMPPVDAAPMEASVSTGSGGSGTTGGGGGGGGSLAGDSASGEASRGLADSSSSEVTTSSPVLMPTSASSYDERDGESDDYAEAEPVLEEEAAESGAVAAPVVANEAVALQPMTAGEIDDNADWDSYQEYRRNFMSIPYLSYGVRDLDITDRQIISVVDSNGLPVLGACVQIYNGESFIIASRTYATGLTLFFPNLNDRTRYIESFRVVVTKSGVSAEATMNRSAIGGLTSVSLPISQSQETVQLDVLFLLDATGSMGTEIQQIQSNIFAISEQIEALPSTVDVRYGLVAYRDRGEPYVTRVYDFTSDVALFQSNLMQVEADGGGDYPEALNEGFNMALNGVNWRGEDAIKLVFLVTDAPPHLDYPNDVDYSILMQDALARGIKIHPIGAKQLEDSPEGEYIVRQMAQYTMGHFIFLTYDNNVEGTTGDDRPDLHVGEARDEQGVGDFSVTQLDELVVRLITDEIAALQGE